MNTMAATGLGTDSPSPRTLLLTASPAFEEEEKTDYGADDEDDGYEVDNSFDYFPTANGSSEDERKEDREEQSVKKDVENGEDESMEASVVEKIEVERHTLIEDTTVVKEYAQIEKEDDTSKQSDELLAVTVTTSSAVIDQETSSTLVSTGRATIPCDDAKDSSEDDDVDVDDPGDLRFSSDDEESDNDEVEESKMVKKKSTTNEEEQVVLGEADPIAQSPSKGIKAADSENGEHEAAQQEAPESPGCHDPLIPSNLPTPLVSGDVQASTPTKPAKINDDMQPSNSLAGDVEKPEESMEMSLTQENEEPGNKNENMEIADEIVVETPQSTEHEATDQQSRQEMRVSTPVSAKSSSSALEATTPAQPMIMMQTRNSASSPRDQPAAASIPDSHSTPKRPQKRKAVAPVHTPKQSKRAASKKRKTLPVPPKSSKSEAKTSRPLRRSSRVKNDPAKFSASNQQLSDVTVMTHFARNAVNEMTCKHCGHKMTASRGIATRHLQGCPVFSNHENATTQIDKVSSKKAKSSLPVHPVTLSTPVQAVKSEMLMTDANDRPALVQLMGSEELANKVKGSFQGTPFVGHAPVSRFQELIRNDITELRHLNVQNLLDAVETEDGPVVQLHPKLSGVRHSTGSHVLEPVSIAKARDLENCPLRFPAPRSVAEHYITPLAKELGLMYAMARHTAKIVSCPLEDTVLDWQFHRSETVVFQLSGRSMWRLKKSQVEYPVECFHPDSWQIGDVAQIAKVHRLSSMNHSNTGFLAPPGDDIDVFDENVNVAGVSDEPEENLLKSGSVLYIPAGVWFETKTLGVNTLWLEVQLGSFTYEELVFSAVKQLVLSDKQCRMRVQLYSGNRHQIKQARHHAEVCIQSLRKEMAELDGSDVLPEYLATEDMQELVAQGLIQVTNKSSNSTSIAVDLTNPRFKLKHSKIFRDAAYRVNPVAVLMRAEEIPYLPAQRSESPSSEGTTPANTSQTQHRALKKTPKPKPKRKQTLRTISHTDKHTYILDENFGNDKRESQLHVMFQCSAEQSKLVEWLRSRGSEPFDLLEFSRGDASVVHQGKGPARCDENARSMLRFLYFVGYVTQVKA
ncbi:hypothetical protein PPTG_19334 [Phytophthora nicotianae INRA-310]|uniref:Uncharacterized protein n=1 Tax=Phytophthora nicotianae (strain INRA-310) TaxID=761204 RepID=W2PF24_PHYN3|nr:hypothetical protein PPTG_19334 [Phytophthora nicotianae INRA-310]ETM98788.1 hypothetical protein PPTG_19334 [Phytophthora nicotianae INRA-310]